MFKVGDTVRFLRHDYFPQVVGLIGSIVSSGRENLPGAAGSPADIPETEAGVPEGAVYQVMTQTRTLHDIPEAWLERLGKGRPDDVPTTSFRGNTLRNPQRPWWMFWG